MMAMPDGPRPCASRRASLRCLALSAAVAIAGCTQTLERDLECVLNSTGVKFTAKAGTRTDYVGGREAVPVRDADGFTMWIHVANVDKWRCRGVAR